MEVPRNGWPMSPPRPDKASFRPGQAAPGGRQFGIEHINVATLICESRLDFQFTGTRNRLKKTNLQRCGHAFDPMVKEAVCHGGIQKSADYSTMQDAGIALPSRISLNESDNGFLLHNEFQAE